MNDGVRAVLAVLDKGGDVAVLGPQYGLEWIATYRAKKHPDWNRIQRRITETEFLHRRRTGDSHTNFDSLTAVMDVRSELYDLERQHSIALWLEDALSEWRARGIVSGPVRETIWAWQRLTRGWDDRATWSMDGYLFRTVGEQLLHLADTTHGWPDDLTDETGALVCPEFEDWQAILRYHGNRLLNVDRVSEQEYNYEVEVKTYEAAQESLRWVADNVGRLWD